MENHCVPSDSILARFLTVNGEHTLYIWLKIQNRLWKKSHLSFIACVIIPSFSFHYKCKEWLVKINILSVQPCLVILLSPLIKVFLPEELPAIAFFDCPETLKPIHLAPKTMYVNSDYLSGIKYITVRYVYKMKKIHWIISHDMLWENTLILEEIMGHLMIFFICVDFCGGCFVVAKWHPSTDYPGLYVYICSFLLFSVYVTLHILHLFMLL